MNTLMLQAVLVERGAMRYTPAGLPALDFQLKHESKVLEAGQERSVLLELRAVAVGVEAERLGRVDVGWSGRFKGFLASQRNRRGTVFHVTEFVE